MDRAWIFVWVVLCLYCCREVGSSHLEFNNEDGFSIEDNAALEDDPRFWSAMRHGITLSWLDPFCSLDTHHVVLDVLMLPLLSGYLA